MSKTLVLEGKTYEVTSEFEVLISLKGSRGGKYFMWRNVNNPSMWCFVRTNSRKPSTTWFQRQFDGSFEKVR